MINLFREQKKTVQHLAWLCKIINYVRYFSREKPFATLQYNFFFTCLVASSKETIILVSKRNLKSACRWWHFRWKKFATPKRLKCLSCLSIASLQLYKWFLCASSLKVLLLFPLSVLRAKILQRQDWNWYLRNVIVVTVIALELRSDGVSLQFLTQK